MYNKSGTVEITSYIKNCLEIETLAHLTCIGSKKEEIIDFLKEFKENNIKNILALRGDIPKERDENIYNERNYKYTSTLIKDIKENGDFYVGGAFYSEVHYENNDLLDLIYLKNKVEVGEDFLISQISLKTRHFSNSENKLKNLTFLSLLSQV
nr:methylenetetrahydrofolate reductase [Leptotrichia sp. OH3620_COT-345]